MDSFDVGIVDGFDIDIVDGCDQGIDMGFNVGIINNCLVGMIVDFNLRIIVDFNIGSLMALIWALFSIYITLSCGVSSCDSQVYGTIVVVSFHLDHWGLLEQCIMGLESGLDTANRNFVFTKKRSH